MPGLGAAARGVGRVNAALACLVVLAACGSVAGASGTASTARSAGARHQLHRRRIADHRLERPDLAGRAAVQPLHQHLLHGT